MSLIKIAGDCGSNDCPGAWTTSASADVLVQGRLRTDITDIQPSAGEVLIEVPAEIILEAARALGR